MKRLRHLILTACVGMFAGACDTVTEPGSGSSRSSRELPTHAVQSVAETEFLLVAKGLAAVLKEPSARARLDEVLRSDGSDPRYSSLSALLQPGGGESLVAAVASAVDLPSGKIQSMVARFPNAVIGFPVVEHHGGWIEEGNVLVAVTAHAKLSTVAAFDSEGRKTYLDAGYEAPQQRVLVISFFPVSKETPLIGSTDRHFAQPLFASDCDPTTVIIECDDGTDGPPSTPPADTLYLNWFQMGWGFGEYRVEFRSRVLTASGYGPTVAHRYWDRQSGDPYLENDPIAFVVPTNAQKVDVEVWEIRHWYHFSDVLRGGFLLNGSELDQVIRSEGLYCAWDTGCAFYRTDARFSMSVFVP
jgi:hypothetical protein